MALLENPLELDAIIGASAAGRPIAIRSVGCACVRSMVDGWWFGMKELAILKLSESDEVTSLSLGPCGGGVNRRFQARPLYLIAARLTSRSLHALRVTAPWARSV